MAMVGYARVSSTGQSLEVQLDRLKAEGCEKVFSEKRSGVTTAERDQLKAVLDWVRDGDVLCITRLDRLARSMADLHNIIARLDDKGATFKVLDQPAVNSLTSDGTLMLNILASFACFETQLRKERQREGIDKAKSAGIYKGRPATIDPARIAALKAEGLGATEIAKRLKIGRASVYRLINEAQTTPPNP